jgi:uncharacterized lipoprotein YddW (UPF0748 family)
MRQLLSRRPSVSLTRFVAVASVFLAACTAPTEPRTDPGPDPGLPPSIAREMRGVWIATVANIDWPSAKGLTAAQQQAELVDLLDRAANGGFNTVVFHVRPAGDAVYASSLEPWGVMLTGTQGGNPGYDPLAFAVQAAHDRGLELHAWINPFRAGNAKDTASFAATHIFKARRDLSRVYGSQVWMDPGEPEVQDRTMAVVLDIVSRYDIDGIHADDYFYPYQERDAANRIIGFPDTTTWTRSGTTLSIDDWRRANIDRFVERMYREVHQVKPTLKVGLSPFGIWRPGYPAGVNGLDAYATIYADSRKWLRSGWVDYLAPQLYWALSAPQQSYTALLDWWIGENVAGRHVWPGLAAYRVNDGTASAFSSGEIAAQVTATRQRTQGTGHLLYNANTTLKRNGGAVTGSLATLYALRALVPASPWLDAIPPGMPSISVNGTTLSITPAAGEAARWWYVRARIASGWWTRVIFGTRTTLTLPEAASHVLVNAVDRAGNASASAEWKAP